MKHLKKAIEILSQEAPCPPEKIVYHGSSEPNLEEIGIESRSPSYEGGLGAGIYIDYNIETAKFYGEYVYALCLKLEDEDILDLSAEYQDSIEGLEETSILIGEFIPPFAFYIGEEKYVVGMGDEGDVYRIYTNILLEIIPTAILPIVEPIIQKEQEESWDGFSTPANLADDWEDNISDYLMNKGKTEDEIIEVMPIILDQVQDAMDAASEQAHKKAGIAIDLDDIRDVAREHGYKGVFFQRGGGTVGDELLIFDDDYLEMIGLVE